MNIIDYCIYYKDVEINQVAFNYVDNVVFSEFSYCVFDDLFNINTEYTIEQLAKAYYKTDNLNSIAVPESSKCDSPELLLLMGKSNRYKNCRVYNYSSIFDKENTEQFCAMMVDLPDKSTAVCFRGTDDSLVGWHEDLNLSYTVVSSQIKAKDYVNKNCKLFRKYRFIGHSKGGNLAIYAALNCNSFVKMGIIQVISNDGPGLKSDTFKQRDLNKLGNKYIKIVPEHDIIGTIFDNDENKIVVQTSKDGILAHSGFTWVVNGSEFVRADDIDLSSKRLKKALSNFIETTSQEDKQMMIEDIFDSLYKANIKYFSQFTKVGMSIVMNTLISIINIEGASKNTAIKLLDTIYQVYEPDLLKKAKSVNSDVSQFISSRINDIQRILNR